VGTAAVGCRTMTVVVTPSEGLARLRAAAGSGELRALCQRQHVTLLTVFGSAGRGEPDPRDLDIGVVTEHGADFDLFGFKVDHGKVSAAILLALEQYGQYVRQVARWLCGHTPGPL
jgi:nucleotidyltransferase-like protein